MNGFLHTRPAITNIDTSDSVVLGFLLADGRTIHVPIHYFPSIAALTPEERLHWTVMDDELFTFAACDDIFHLEQVLGKESQYSYRFADVVS
jgi:hypothetical protein